MWTLERGYDRRTHRAGVARPLSLRSRDMHSLHGRRFRIASASTRSSSTSARPSMHSAVQ